MVNFYDKNLRALNNKIYNKYKILHKGRGVFYSKKHSKRG